MEQRNTADFVIIGGGVIGCSTAYNLANQGAKNVVLLEKGDICSGGTAKSCAITRSHYTIEANMHHAVESTKIFENFDQIVGGDANFQRTGYIILGSEEIREKMETVFEDEKGNIIQNSPGSSLMGNPMNVVMWLIDDFNKRGITLKAGDRLSLGSVGKLFPLKEGSKTYTYTLKGISEIPVKSQITINE